MTEIVKKLVVVVGVKTYAVQQERGLRRHTGGGVFFMSNLLIVLLLLSCPSSPTEIARTVILSVDPLRSS